MSKKSVVSMILAAGILTAPMAILACDGAGPATHIGKVTAIDASGKKFTIRDAQTQGPITFVANDEIIKGLENAKGMVTVKYEEGKEGSLKAVGVTF